MRRRRFGRTSEMSIAREIHAEVVLLLGWGRAILLQISHPLVARGVADHSTFRGGSRAWVHRLRRTLGVMLATSFGDEAEAARAVAGMNAIHARVSGRLASPEGPASAGTPYSARDPALLLWVHATTVDSFIRAYELFVRTLGDEEKDRYCAEASRIESSLGVPEGLFPRSFGALQAYLDGMLSGDQIAVTDAARGLARAVLDPPLPAALRPAVWLARLPTLGLLPPSLRRAYGFDWRWHHRTALALSAAIVRGVLPAVPRRIRHWPAARGARRREATGAGPGKNGAGVFRRLLPRAARRDPAAAGRRRGPVL